MPDPIRPEDHSMFDGSSRLPAIGVDMWHDALNEAIHQTFERDAAKIGVPSFSGGGEVDPDTEIDRLARLIVDGEYRRRKESEDA